MRPKPTPFRFAFLWSTAFLGVRPGLEYAAPPPFLFARCLRLMLVGMAIAPWGVYLSRR